MFSDDSPPAAWQRAAARVFSALEALDVIMERVAYLHLAWVAVAGGSCGWFTRLCMLWAFVRWCVAG